MIEIGTWWLVGLATLGAFIALTTLVFVYLAYYEARYARIESTITRVLAKENKESLKEANKATNGRLDQLVASKGAEAHAIGMLAGAEERRNYDNATIENARKEAEALRNVAIQEALIIKEEARRDAEDLLNKAREEARKLVLDMDRKYTTGMKECDAE